MQKPLKQSVPVFDVQKRYAIDPDIIDISDSEDEQTPEDHKINENTNWTNSINKNDKSSLVQFWMNDHDMSIESPEKPRPLKLEKCENDFLIKEEASEQCPMIEFWPAGSKANFTKEVPSNNSTVRDADAVSNDRANESHIKTNTEQIESPNSGEPAKITTKTTAASAKQNVQLRLRRHSIGFYVEQSDDAGGNRSGGETDKYKRNKDLSSRLKPTRNSTNTRNHQTSAVSDNFKCEVVDCNYIGKTKYHWRNHMVTHSNERPFHCEQCPKRFSRLGSLVTHIRIHTNERPYQCAYCPKKFIQMNHCQQHERNHATEKPYQCKQCFKGFIHKSSLYAHQQIHTQIEP